MEVERSQALIEVRLSDINPSVARAKYRIFITLKIQEYYFEHLRHTTVHQAVR